jgi:hypothetical protein
MFIFIQSNSCEQNDILWNNFILDVYQNLNNKNCLQLVHHLPFKLFESIFIQEIYNTYILTSTQKLYYGFNYNNPPVHLSNENFWKVCTVQQDNNFYYYHKITNLLFIKNGTHFIWIGIYDTYSDNIIYRNECSKHIEKWVIECGFI